MWRGRPSLLLLEVERSIRDVGAVICSTVKHEYFFQGRINRPVCEIKTTRRPLFARQTAAKQRRQKKKTLRRTKDVQVAYNDKEAYKDKQHYSFSHRSSSN